MKTYRLIGFLAIILGLYIGACGLNTPGDQSDVSNITFEEVSKYRQSSRCKENKNLCATVSINFPQATNGDAFVLNKINGTTQNKVLESLAIFSDLDKQLVANIDSAMVEFIKLYDEFITESEFFTLPWELNITGEVTYQSDKIVSIKLVNQSYTGGAHGNSYTHLLNFNTETGKLLSLNDVIFDRNQLMSILDQKNRGKSDNPSTSEPSIELASESYFNLPKNFAIQRNGILFFYNPYERGTFAEGSSSFFITFDVLESVLRKDLLFNK